MAMQSRSKIVPSFPDVKMPEGGRFGGVALGLKTAMEQGNINRKLGISEKLLGVREQAYEKALTTSEKKNFMSFYNAEIDASNKELDYVEKVNAKIMDKFNTLGEATNYLLKKPERPSYEKIKQKYDTLFEAPASTPSSGNAMMGGPGMSTIPPVELSGRVPGGAQLSQPQGFMQKIGSMGAEMGAGIGEKLKSLFGAPGAAQPPQGAPTMQPGGAVPPDTAGQNAGFTTDQLLQTLDDYEDTDADSAIADIIALDEQFNQEGLFLGDDVDTNVLIEAFRNKFGDQALQKLQSMVT